MNIEIWSIGRENESYVEEGVNLFFRKTKHWCQVSLIALQLPQRLQTEDARRTKALEEEMVLRRIQPHHHVVLLDERGQMLRSEQWALYFQQQMNSSTRTLVFLIGGAFGVTDNVRRKAAQVWSLSSLVLPHQLVRLVVAEQVYRAFTILHGLPYHHA